MSPINTFTRESRRRDAASRHLRGNAMAQDSEAVSAPLIERRSIDYIPESERHGKLYSQFTLWMGANLQITAMVTGALAVVLGGDVFWGRAWGCRR
ncbi:hypothetical protein G6F50_017874 [Rhizopus delemar]|uniref:Uncharacterized protein n=1 Tax=Rhizopus delemar TaxID=936053 RepID=A0A9P6XNU6_9FUNG|nr:hypothetical protein G6F50_017874 [Rhizopus delemar]